METLLYVQGSEKDWAAYVVLYSSKGSICDVLCPVCDMI